ncbi:MAG: dTDP-glucose 4,6-dehydratase [Pyrinomonadaceae bacterium]
MSIMITGGLGFIGSHLANKLAARDDVSKIIAVDMIPSSTLSGQIISCTDKIEFICVSILDEQRVIECAARCSLIFHLAAETHVQNSIVDPRTAVHTNIIGTFSILEAARQNRCRVIFTSTSEVYGVPDERITNSHPLEPYSPYAATKIAGDRLVAAYVRTYGINASVVRLFNTYGPGQYFEKLIPMLICSTLCNLPLPIQGDGSATRDWSYVDDVCDRLISLIPSESVGLCNLASGNTRTVNQIAVSIAAMSGRPAEILRYRERPGHVASQAAAVSSIAECFKPASTSFADGLLKTYHWYQERIALWKPMFLQSRSGLLAKMQ